MLKLAIVLHWKNAIYKILWPTATVAATLIMQFPFASTHISWLAKKKQNSTRTHTNAEHKYL